MLVQQFESSLSYVIQLVDWKFTTRNTVAYFIDVTDIQATVPLVVVLVLQIFKCIKFGFVCFLVSFDETMKLEESCVCLRERYQPIPSAVEKFNLSVFSDKEQRLITTLYNIDYTKAIFRVLDVMKSFCSKFNESSI